MIESGRLLKRYLVYTINKTIAVWFSHLIGPMEEVVQGLGVTRKVKSRPVQTDGWTDRQNKTRSERRTDSVTYGWIDEYKDEWMTRVRYVYQKCNVR